MENRTTNEVLVNESIQPHRLDILVDWNDLQLKLLSKRMEKSGKGFGKHHEKMELNVIMNFLTEKKESFVIFREVENKN